MTTRDPFSTKEMRDVAHFASFTYRSPGDDIELYNLQGTFSTALPLLFQTWTLPIAQKVAHYNFLTKAVHQTVLPPTPGTQRTPTLRPTTSEETMQYWERLPATTYGPTSGPTSDPPFSDTASPDYRLSQYLDGIEEDSDALMTDLIVKIVYNWTAGRIPTLVNITDDKVFTTGNGRRFRLGTPDVGLEWYKQQIAGGVAGATGAASPVSASASPVSASASLTNLTTPDALPRRLSAMSVDSSVSTSPTRTPGSPSTIALNTLRKWLPTMVILRNEIHAHQTSPSTSEDDKKAMDIKLQDLDECLREVNEFIENQA